MENMASNYPSSSDIIRLDALIVGSGFAGLYALHKLRRMGLVVRACEAGQNVGGTWYWNRYPGARCDVESVQYSFSFSEPLQQSWRWPDKYAVQRDILNYIVHVADHLDLRRDIEFSTRVISQSYDETECRWIVKTDTGKRFSARFCIMASGNLSLPSVPDFAGLEAFKGTWFHAARWPDDGVDVQGKKVGLIGTGATGVQMVPQIAAQAEHLYVFQRTANFSIPARNAPVSDAADKSYKAHYPEWRRAALEASFGMSGIQAPAHSALNVSSETRRQIYEEKWQLGGSINFLNAFNDLLTSEQANDTAAEFVRDKIRATVTNPVTAEMLCPKDHPIGSKRLCVDTDYYESFNQSNVSLIDVKHDPIERITETGVKTAQAEYAVDMLVFATGFDAMTGALLAIDIRGKNGQSLAEKWQDGPVTYLGLMTSGFPNLFIVTGPGSPSVKSNMVLSIEQHVDWIAACLQYLTDHNIPAIEAEPGAEQAWVTHVNEVAEATLYTKADSWYLGSNIPGKPRIFMPYVGGVPAYRKKCEAVVQARYEGFSLGNNLPS